MHAVSGGFSFFGITEIESGLKLMSQASAVVKAAAKTFALGYAAGSVIYYSYEHFTGDSLGGDMYDLCQAWFN